jgi:hypothetical protein
LKTQGTRRIHYTGKAKNLDTTLSSLIHYKQKSLSPDFVPVATIKKVKDKLHVLYSLLVEREREREKERNKIS